MFARINFGIKCKLYDLFQAVGVQTVADYRQTLISSPSLEEFLTVVNDIVNSLTEDEIKQFNSVLDSYFVSYGFGGTWERMNNRTIGQVFNAAPVRQEPIASGESGDIRYRLYQRPSSEEDPGK